MTLTIIGALFIGAGVGVLTAIFGVGGGFLITPLLHIVLGMPMPLAVGTSAVQILGVSTCSLYERRHSDKPAAKLAIVAFGGNYVGVQLGADLLHYLDGLGTVSVNGFSFVAADMIILAIFIPLLLGIAYRVYRDTRQSAESASRVGWFARVRIPPFTRFEELDQPELSLPVLAYFGLFMGFCTGLLGIGGGVLLFPALIYLVGLHTRRAAATSLVMVWLTSAIAVVTHTAAGNVDYGLVVPLLFGGTLGAHLGARWGAMLSGREIKRYFVYVLVLAAIMVALKIGFSLF
ncbi:MAG: sulfite exporter TauE/SafE family protein [Chloroflexi bacterium]|nr:sulfite exporter TauE/SafE family protein [Chloroflexota bacterium]